jgi:prepilin-type N-terminal cleavage/methylation domain-containing protein
MINKKIKAFTLAELLVTLALTSIMVTLSYMGLNYIQKLLFQYQDQNTFITRLNDLNKRLDFSFDEALSVQKEGERSLILRKDSSETKVEFGPYYILTVKNNRTDTFMLDAKDLKIENESLNETVQEQLIKKVEFDIYFQKQKFHLTFSKNYDAYSKLMLETKDAGN